MEVAFPAKWGKAAFIAVIFVAVGILNYRYVIADFTRGASLLDTGWFAYLLDAGDPMLTNPRAIGEYSYYNIHISPYFSVLSVLAKSAHLNGFQALAIHQGATFALLFLGLALFARKAGGASSWLLLMAATLVMLFGNIALQIASLPHYEQAILSFSVLGLYAFNSRRFVVATVLFAVATLVREDGGLYVALFLLANLLSSHALKLNAWVGSYSFWSCLLAGLASLSLFWIKGTYFNLVPTFSSNFSGNGWDHLSFEMIMSRIESNLARPEISVTLLSAALLALLDWRYGLTAVLILPLVAAHLASVREDLGTFNYYYVMVWLVPWVGFFAELSRSPRRKASIGGAIVCVAALCVSFPLLQSLGLHTYGHIVTNALFGGLVNPDELAKGIHTAGEQFATPCYSSGAAAFIPDDLGGNQWISPGANLLPCDGLVLAVGDVHYGELRKQAQEAGFGLQQTVLGRIEVYAASPPV